MNVNEARQARERLKPIRRILDDLDGVIDFASHAESDFETLNAQIPKLKAERDKAAKELEAKRNELKTAVMAHAKQTRDMQQSYSDQVGAKEKELSELNAEILAVEKEHKKRMAEMEAEYKDRLNALKNVVADLEAKRDSLIADIQARKERVMAL